MPNFRKPWVGPFMITTKLSDLSYRIVNQHGRDPVVHTTRLKQAYDQDVWKVSHCKKSSKKKRTPSQKSEEDEWTVLTKGPIIILEPQVETRRPVPLSPNPFSPTTLHTPGTRPQASDVPGSECADPSYVPSDTEHSRRKLCTTTAYGGDAGFTGGAWRRRYINVRDHLHTRVRMHIPYPLNTMVVHAAADSSQLSKRAKCTDKQRRHVKSTLWRIYTM